ncbi:MAG: SpoIIE family protein phosphatase [Bryobacteraceae bacterium]|nr:SpoIIE family protein phosphatase [Bryobacteraceae bacterium]
MAQETTQLARFRDRTELLDFLLEVSQAAAETLDLDALMDKLAGIVQTVVPYDLFAILLYTERNRGLRLRFSIGHRSDIVDRLVIPLEEGLTGAAARTLTPILVGDVRNDPRYLGAVDAVRTELAVPMVARGRLVGVVDLQSTRLNAYTDEDSALVRLIASRAAASIDNANLYRRVSRQNHTLRTLAAMAHTFSSTLNLNDVLNRIAATIRKLIHYDALSILLVDERHKLLRSRFSIRYDQRFELDNLPLGKGITGAAVESKKPILVEDTRRDPRYIESTPGIRSEVAVPLLIHDHVLGVLDLECDRVGYFTETHLQTLLLLAPLIANSIENARLYEDIAARERRSAENLRAARTLQETLLLREPPPIEGLDIAVRSRAAQEISGDVYDFFEQGEQHVITFGDVSGKGAAAALYGALLNGLLRTLAPRRAGPASLLRTLNETLVERKVHATYVTLLVLYWEPPARTLRMANSGVFPPIIYRRGEILKQRVEGIPLGLLDDREYDEERFEAEPGDVVLLYSDGIHDQQNPAGEEFDRRPLYSLLEQNWRLPAAGIVERVFETLDRFMSGVEIHDDQTMIVIKVK